MEKECIGCGAFFESTNMNQKYCPACRERGTAKVKREMEKNLRHSIWKYGYGKERGPIEQTCTQCGKVFIEMPHAIEPGGPFCSPACSKEYRIKNATCANCKVNLYKIGIDISEESGTVHFCSEQCKKEMYERIAQTKKETALIEGDIRPCKQCGKEFSGRGYSQYCSSECEKAAEKDGTKVVERACLICHKRFCTNAAHESKFCSKSCYDKYVERAKEYKARKERDAQALQRRKDAQARQRKERLAESNTASLCATCSTCYPDCDWMTSNFVRYPVNTIVNKDGYVVSCPKYK